MIFLTTYFRTIPMADVDVTSLVTSLTCHHCVSFTVALVIYKLQRILKGLTSLVAQRLFTSMMRIMQPASRGLACRIPCCRSQSGLFSALAVNVPQAHAYMRAIQPCNTDLYCIVVTSWHCVLHRKLAIKQASKHIYLSNMTGYQKSHWLNNAGSSHKEQKTYILATPHRHNITVINAKEQQQQ